MAPPARLAVRPDPARPGGRGAALRAGDLRGPEGLPSRRRLDLDVPARRERRAHAALGRAGSRCPSCRASTSSTRCAQLIAVDADWVPTAPETSLYLRPFMFAKEAFLGVRPAKKVAYYLIASPAGAYFHGGVQPVSIWLSDELRPRRQGRHGCGEDRRQLRVEPAAAGRGGRARLPAGAVPRRGQVPRGARRHERRARLQGRHARHARVRLDPRGHHARLGAAARGGPRPHGRAAAR